MSPYQYWDLIRRNLLGQLIREEQKLLESWKASNNEELYNEVRLVITDTELKKQRPLASYSFSGLS